MTKNLSKGPTGLLKWVGESLEEKKIAYKLVSEPEVVNKLRNKLILIYPSKNFFKLSKETRRSNKITTIGPDSITIQYYSLLLFYFPFLKKLFLNRFIKKTLCNIFDDVKSMKNNTNLLVGKNDVKFLNKIGGKYQELPHPFISSVNSKEPLLPSHLIDNDIIIIGKSNGLPTAFKDLEKPIKKYLIPLINLSKRKLYIFESTGLNIEKNSNIEFISRSTNISSKFFQSKIVLNPSICGGGTANRSLSALFDGSFLFSTEFGIRNIDLELFRDRIIVSEYSPFKKEFYEHLMRCKFSKINPNNIDNIIKKNKISEGLFFKSLNL